VEDVAADTVEGAAAETAVEIEKAEEAIGVASAEWDGDDAAKLVGDYAFATDGLALAADVADDVFLTGGGCVAQNGVGDLGVVCEGETFVVEAGFKTKVGSVVAEEDEATLGAGEAEGVFDHGAEDVVEDAGVIEALRGLKEEGELFELCACGVARDAVEQKTCGGVLLVGVKEENYAGGADLDAVAGVKAGGLFADAVDESAVATALVLDEETLCVFSDDGVLAGDLRVGQA
jgi:hypothetical protein